MANQVEIIMGTYENYLLGFKVGKDKNGSEIISQSFITKSHMGAVKTLAISGKFLASGGSDGNVIIYNMQTRREMQTLDFHEEQINSVAFTPKSTHILSGSNDGKMCAVRVGSWQKEATWEKAHGGSAVTIISCHPSGKLALSLGNDLTLRTWNLVKGRIAYTHNLKNSKNQGIKPDCLAWSTEGDYFCMTTARTVEIWKLSTAGLVTEHACESKPTAVCWLSNELLAVGLENGKIMMVPVNDNNTTNNVNLIEAHKERVKGIAVVNDIIVTASSGGEVILWQFERNDQSWMRLCSTKMNVRPICIGLLDLNQFGDDYILKKEKEEKEEEVEKTSVNDRKKTTNVGSVSIEYEGDDDELEIIFSSNKSPNKAINKQKINTESQTKRHNSAKDKTKKQDFVETNNNNTSKNKKGSNLKLQNRQIKSNEIREESSISIKKRKYESNRLDVEIKSNNENNTLTSIQSQVEESTTGATTGKLKKRVGPTFGELKGRRKLKLGKKVKKDKLLKLSGITMQ